MSSTLSMQTAMIVLGAIAGALLYLVFIGKVLERCISNYQKLVDEAGDAEHAPSVPFGIYALFVIYYLPILPIMIFMIIIKVICDKYGNVEDENNNDANDANAGDDASPGTSGQQQGKDASISKAKKTSPKVTRAMIDNYVPDYSSKLAKNFDPTNPETSFTRITKYSRLGTHFPDTSKDDLVCCICLEDYQPESNVLVFPCHHFLHNRCAKDYQKRGKGHEAVELQFRCFICQLNMLKHYLYYKSHNYNPDLIPFENKRLSNSKSGIQMV